MRRDEREQRIADVEYLSQAVRAKAEECLAAVDDGELSLAKRVKTSHAQCSCIVSKHSLRFTNSVETQH